VTDFIRTQVRRANRNLLLWNASFLLLMLGLAWLSRTYWYNFFFGPFRVTDNSLLALAREPGGGLLAYVELQGRKLTTTSFTEVTTVDNRLHTSFRFFTTPVGDRLLLVLARSSGDEQRLLGTVYRVPDEVDRDVIGGLIRKRPELRGRFLPVMLNATVAFPIFGWVCLAIVSPLALLCLVNLARGLLRSANPRLHPLARPEEIAAQIDREVAEDSAQRFGTVFVTRSWLLQPTTFGLRRIRLEDAVWVCELTGARFGLVFRLRNGKTTGVLLKRGLAAPALQAVVNRVPWILAGFDPQRLQDWQKRRSELIALVDERRKRSRA
jgi:hypothetical protein